MSAKWGRAPWGLFGMLVLVLLVERSLPKCEIDLMLPQHWDWRQAAKASRSTDVTESEILCFGDSLMKQAVQPIVIEAKTGRPTYNLAVSMGQPPTSYFLLRRALRAGAKPKLILLDAAALVLGTTADNPSMMRQWPELLDAEERLDLARTAGSADLFLRLTLAKHWPSLRMSADVRAAAVGWASGNPASSAANRRFLMAQLLRNGRVNRGANAMRYNPKFLTDLSALSMPLFQEFRFHPLNVTYLERFLDLAAAHEIPVVALLTPLSPLAQKHTEENGFEASQTHFFRSLQGRHPGLQVADARRSHYGAELHYMDPLHLNHRGATALSDDLAVVIERVIARQPLPPDGWVSLPSFDARPRGIDLEDIDDSAMAIADQARGTIKR